MEKDINREQTAPRSDHPDSSDKSLSKPKKILFRASMVLLLLALFVFIEIGLRPFDLKKTGKISEYVLTKDSTKRHVFQTGITPPIPLSQTFGAEKDSRTYRNSSLGESSFEGFRYPPTAAFSAVLENILPIPLCGRPGELSGLFGSASRLSLESRTLRHLFLKLQQLMLSLPTRNVMDPLIGKDLGNNVSLHRGVLSRAWF